MVRGPCAASSVSTAFCPAARRSFSIFSNDATSGFAAQIVGCDTEIFWAEEMATRAKGNANIAKRRTIDMELPSRKIGSELIASWRESFCACSLLWWHVALTVKDQRSHRRTG